MKKNRFVRGVVWLCAFGVISKALGAVYRIPLTHLLTSEGMGLYQMVFPLYSLLLALSSSGFPASISKLVAESNARGEYGASKKILRLSLLLLCVFSVICCLSLWLFGGKIASLQGNSNAKSLYMAIAPAILIVGIISGFKGYFQGHEDMVPSSISMIVEQLGKLLFGLLFAKIFSKHGVAFAALGAIIGVVISEAVVLLFFVIYYVFFNKKCKKPLTLNNDFTNKSYVLRILGLSLPIAFGALIVPACMFVDSAVVVNLLQKYGATMEEATSLFGLSSGVVGAIVNMPVVFAIAIGTAIVPLASRTQAQNNTKKMQEHLSIMLVLTFVVMIPCAVVLFVFSDMIINFLYGGCLSAIQTNIASQLLKFGAIGSIFLALVQVSSSFLQGLGKNFVPAISLLVGAGIKIGLTFFLVPRGLSIFSAEIASAVCYSVAGIINLSVILKHYQFVMSGELVKVLSGSVLIFVSALVIRKVVLSFSSGKIALLLGCFAVFVVIMLVYYMMYRNQVNKFLMNRSKKKQKAVE